LVIHALDIGVNVFRFILRLASRSGIWTLQISSYWKPLIFGVLLICMALICIDSYKWKIRSGICVISACFAWFFMSSQPELIQLSLKKGQSILYRKGRHAMIINTGAVYFNFNDHKRYIQPILDHWGICDITIIITAWEKGKYGNIASLRRMYPECKLVIPETDALVEEDHMMLNGDTLIQCGKTVFYLKGYDGEITPSFKIGNNEIKLINNDSSEFPIIPINECRTYPRHFVFYGDYLYK
ncbi:MAG: hypothetical protein DRP93_04340, partial [Candidatus Neomarinimicrobiota bacterium]